MQPPRARFVIAFLTFAIACHSPTSPSNGQAATTEHGRLSGVVTIGPNCPVQTETNPCPTSPLAYAARKILVYNAAKTSLLFTVDIDSQGLYVIDLVPGSYTVDLKPSGVDRTSDLPKVVEIKVNVVTQLDVNIDTGIR
jgi:hypothetical protein